MTSVCGFPVYPEGGLLPLCPDAAPTPPLSFRPRHRQTHTSPRSPAPPHHPPLTQDLCSTRSYALCCWLAAQPCPILFATPKTVARHALLFMGLSRQEYWSGLPFPSPGDHPNPGIEPVPPALAGGFFTTEPPVKPSHALRAPCISP